MKWQAMLLELYVDPARTPAKNFLTRIWLRRAVMALGGRCTFTLQHGLYQKPSITCCNKCNFQHQGRAHIEQFGLEGTFKSHLVQQPCNEQGHHLLDQVAWSPVQPHLECFQGWGIYHLSRKFVPVFYHPHCKRSLPHIWSNPTLI